MTTQRTFEPHEFAPYAEANNICRHCDRGRYALHHEQPRPEQATTEFDQVFDQMEAPEYPATCDNCGEVGTNASMEQHECDEHDAPAAPERGGGQWSYFLDTDGYYYICRDGNIPLTIAKTEYKARAIEIITEHNQHSTLIAQRERLLAAIRKFVNYYDGANAARLGNGQARRSLNEFKEAIATSEQEGRTER